MKSFERNGLLSMNLIELVSVSDSTKWVIINGHELINWSFFAFG